MIIPFGNHKITPRDAKTIMKEHENYSRIVKMQNYTSIFIVLSLACNFFLI